MKFDIFKNEPNKNGLPYSIKYYYNKDGDLTSILNYHRMYSLSPEPKYLYKYLPIVCEVCNHQSYHNSPEWDEYSTVHQCLKCQNLMEVEYEKWSDKLLYNESNCPSCGKSFEIGEYGRGLNYCNSCKSKLEVASLE